MLSGLGSGAVSFYFLKSGFVPFNVADPGNFMFRPVKLYLRIFSYKLNPILLEIMNKG